MAIQKSITEIIQERKDQYQQSIQATIEKVYKTGNLQRIEKIERAIDYMTRMAAGSLEKIASESPNAQAPAAEKKPKLTFYQYAKSRKAGMNDAQIKEEFQFDSYHQFAAFASNYSRQLKNKMNSRKSRLNYSSRDPEGMRNEAYARLDGIRKDKLDSKEIIKVLGVTSNSYPTLFAKYPEMQAHVTRESRRIYFDSAAVRNFIATRVPCGSGWMNKDSYNRNKNQRKQE